MKIDKQSLLLGLLIGLLVGGAAIGILDAKRPKPLFSSANADCPEASDLIAARDQAREESHFLLYGGDGKIKKYNLDAAIAQEKIADELQAQIDKACPAIVQ